MGRMYSATFEEVAVTAQQDLIEISTISDFYFTVIHSISLTQSSDAGDAASEMLNILGVTNIIFTGSGGSVVTAAPMIVGDTAYDGDVAANNTTKATLGASTRRHFSESFNIFSGLKLVFSPTERPTFSAQSERGNFFLRLETTPADSLTMSCTIVFEQI